VLGAHDVPDLERPSASQRTMRSDVSAKTKSDSHDRVLIVQEAARSCRKCRVPADKVIKTKVGVLELGKQLGNVSKACRIIGYSRDTVFIGLKRCTRLVGKSPSGDIAEQSQSKERDRGEH
jgi:hypothetical protein